MSSPENPGRFKVWLRPADVVRLVDAQPQPFRALATLREGAGVEVSAAIRVRRRDVDLRRWVIQVTGTKNTWRTRPVLVFDDWARKRLRAYIVAGRFTPDALLFDGVTERHAWGVQKEALEALKLDTGYTLHDARHSFAIQKLIEGYDPQLIANNLGHKDTSMLWRVYGKYRQTAQDLARIRIRALP